MNAVATKTIYTPEDLLAMPDEENYELVDGHLVERKISTLSSWVAGELHGEIRSYCPRARAVRIHRASGPVSWLRAEDELSGEEVLLGFRCPVAALFPPWADAQVVAGPT
jgi:hypothetical protein